MNFREFIKESTNGKSASWVKAFDDVVKHFDNRSKKIFKVSLSAGMTGMDLGKLSREPKDVQKLVRDVASYIMKKYGKADAIDIISMLTDESFEREVRRAAQGQNIIKSLNIGESTIGKQLVEGIDRAKIAYSNAWKFSNTDKGLKMARDKTSAAKGFVEVLMGDDQFIVPANAKDFSALQQAGYEVVE